MLCLKTLLMPTDSLDLVHIPVRQPCTGWMHLYFRVKQEHACPPFFR
jgi:hypothetical protein